MPIRSSQPDIPVKATADKIARDLDRQHTRSMFQTFIGGLLFLHLGLTLVLQRGGILGYVENWTNIFGFLLANPIYSVVLMLALILLYQGLHLWKHPEPDEIVLPEYPPVEDLRFVDALHIGSGWTRDGKQPGDSFAPAEEDLLDEPHVILQEKGLYGNIHVTGGVGSGKTSTFIYPVLSQSISKWPKPPHPSSFQLGSDGRYSAASAPPAGGASGFLTSLARTSAAGPAAGTKWRPYAGMTEAEALAEYERLLEQHKQKKWGVFLIDAKGDITEMVQRMAALAGREDDVIVLKPGGEHTYNPLLVNADPLVQSEMVLDGIEAVSGSAIQSYWRGVMGEWLANALALLRIIDPTRITFRSILRMARSETLRSSMVSEAQAIMNQAQEEEEKLRRVGKEYTGIKVDPSVVDFFRDWDDDDASAQQKRDVVSSVKSQSKYFVADNMAPFLCPELPPTFPGFDEMIDRGLIICLQMPLAEYEKVAKVLGILMLADAQQAARARINRPWINQDRVLMYCVDEIASFLNPITRDFLSQNRQSKVCFVAAHQSQGQLIRGNDRSFEQGFTDNLRSRFSFNAPNAEAAKKQSSLYGARHVIKESWSESQNFSNVKHEPGTDAIKPKGGESQGAMVRYDEVERHWFDADGFMTLRTGECIAMEFNGETTLHPRKILCPAWYKSAEFARAMELEVPPLGHRPHPVLRVTGVEGNRDKDYVSSALAQTGYCVIEPLADSEGDLVGFKLVTDVGTLIVSCDVLEANRDEISDSLTEPQILVAFTDLRVGAEFFVRGLGFTFERVVALPNAYAQLFPGAGSLRWHEVVGREAGDLSYGVRGAWEYHTQHAEGTRLLNQKSILKDSRRSIEVFLKIGEALHVLGDSAVEEMYEATREQMANIIHGPHDPDPDPAPDGGPDLDPEHGAAMWDQSDPVAGISLELPESASEAGPTPVLASPLSLSSPDDDDDDWPDDDPPPRSGGWPRSTPNLSRSEPTPDAPAERTPTPAEQTPEAEADPADDRPARRRNAGAAGGARRKSDEPGSGDKRRVRGRKAPAEGRARGADKQDDTLDLFPGAPID
jgi:hypothetical protein